MKDNLQNPWAGLASYPDPETSDVQLKFCGRDNESFDVAQLIDDNIFVTLYGKSGTGKTSLLNAGVFPRLRKEHYLPISIRLSMDALNTTFQECIEKKMQQIYEEKGRIQTIDVVPIPLDNQSIEYLWSLFACTRFVDSEGQVLFPVLVFDQFEEVFRDRRKEAEALLRQIHFMMDESHALSDRVINGVPYVYDFNFRFVVSIREDDLYRLEDSIDNNYLADMKRCRYRLRNLTEHGARAAILTPGEGLFHEKEKETVIQKLIGEGSIARNKEDQSISTNVLSLICNRIFVDFQKSGADHITPSLVDTFIKGNPFERFYNEATRGLSNKGKSYIEDHLVDSTGRRNSVSEHDFLRHVPNGALLLEGSRKILQRTSVSSDAQDFRIELIHDSFCEPMSALKQERERRRKITRYFTVGTLVSAGIGLLFVFNYLVKQNKKKDEAITNAVVNLEFSEQERDAIQKQKDAITTLYDSISQLNDSMSNQLTLIKYQKVEIENERDNVTRANYGINVHLSRILAQNTSKLTSDGDSYLARLLALQALPPNRPYTKEAEVALRSACQHNGAILTGHSDMVYYAEFSPDGKRLVSTSKDYTIRIWDSNTGSGILTLKGHTSQVHSASFSPDGKYIVSASSDKTVRIWDTKTGYQVGSPLQGHTSQVSSASFSPDGQYIVSASSDNTVRLWDAKTGHQVGSPLQGHTSQVSSASFSPDGKYIVSASSDKTVRIWDAKTGHQVGNPLQGHTGGVNSASFSPDGKYIVSASYDHTVRIWDAKTGQQVGNLLQGHTGGINSASFSPDGKYIVSASDDTIFIWNSFTVALRQKLYGHTGQIRSVKFSPDGTQIVSASDDYTIRIWDIGSDQGQRSVFFHQMTVNFTSYSPDGKLLVSASDDRLVHLWNLQTKTEITLSGHDDFVRCVVFSPDSKRLVSASKDRTIRVWDMETLKEIKTLTEHSGSVNSVCYSPDGRFILSASNDHSILVWDAHSFKLLHKLTGHSDIVNSAAYSTDGKYIISASKDSTIRIWNSSTGEPIRKLAGHINVVNTAFFSPDGHYIVSASWDNTIRIWDTYTYQTTHILRGHTDFVRFAIFSPNGHYIVSASNDHTICVWDVETGTLMRTFRGHTAHIWSAVFSPNGDQIASASNDNTVRIWDFPPLNTLIYQTRERFKNRQLTPEERRKYYLE